MSISLTIGGKLLSIPGQFPYIARGGVVGRVIDRCITTSGICMCEMSQLAFLRWYIYMALGHELLQQLLR